MTIQEVGVVFTICAGVIRGGHYLYTVWSPSRKKPRRRRKSCRRKLRGMKKARVEANGISLGRYDFSWDHEGTIERMTGRIYARQYVSRFVPLIGKTVKLVEPAGVDFVVILEIQGEEVLFRGFQG